MPMHMENPPLSKQLNCQAVKNSKTQNLQTTLSQSLFQEKTHNGTQSLCQQKEETHKQNTHKQITLFRMTHVLEVLKNGLIGLVLVL